VNLFREHFFYKFFLFEADSVSFIGLVHETSNIIIGKRVSMLLTWRGSCPSFLSLVYFYFSRVGPMWAWGPSALYNLKME